MLWQSTWWILLYLGCLKCFVGMEDHSITRIRKLKSIWINNFKKWSSMLESDLPPRPKLLYLMRPTLPKKKKKKTRPKLFEQKRQSASIILWWYIYFVDAKPWVEQHVFFFVFVVAVYLTSFLLKRMYRIYFWKIKSYYFYFKIIFQIKWYINLLFIKDLFLLEVNVFFSFN